MTSFRKRLGSVVMLYTTRPLTWFLVILWIGLHLCFPVQGVRTLAEPMGRPILGELVSWEDLSSLRNAKQSPREQWVQRIEQLRIGKFGRMNCLSVGSELNVTLSDSAAGPPHPPLFKPEHMQALAQYHELRALRLDMLNPTTEMVKAFDSLTGLQILDFRLMRITPELMTAIGHKKDLRQLRFWNCTFLCDAQALGQLTQLELLDINECGEEANSFLATLPKETTIRRLGVGRHGKVRLDPDLMKNPAFHPAISFPVRLTHEEMAAVSRLSRIQWLYLSDELKGLDGPTFDDVRRSLPNIAVRPRTFLLNRILAVGAMLASMMPILLLTGVMQSAPFSHNGARLTPGYQLPHLVITAAIIAFVAIIEWSGIIRLRVAPLPGLVVAFGIPSFAALFMTAMSAVGNIRSPLVRTWSSVILLVIASAIPVTMTINLSASAEFDWFLQGQLPAISIAALVLCLVAAGLYFQIPFDREVVRLQEMFGRTPPLGINLGEWQSFVTSTRLKNEKLYGMKLWGLPTLPNWLRPGLFQEGLPQRLRIWREGNWLKGRSVIPYGAVIASAVGLVAFHVLNHYKGVNLVDFWSKETAVAIAVSAILGIEFTTLITAVHWFQRRSIFSFEYLHPVSRTQFAMDLLRSLIQDMITAVSIELIAATFIILIYGLQHLIPLAALAIVGRMVMYAAMTYWGLSLRNEILLIGLGIVAYLFAVASGSIVFATVAVRCDPTWDGKDAVMSLVVTTLVGVVSIVLGLIAIRWSYHRWCNHEFR